MNQTNKLKKFRKKVIEKKENDRKERKKERK